MSEQPDINQAITGAEYAATSANGNANIQIYNYYYGELIEIKATQSANAVDESLPCPYRGLFHFGPDDAEYFFGREVFIEELFIATKTRNFIPVLGASGSGKSSVVLAGLVPKLQQAGHWLFTHFRPGSEPFHALALALVPLYTKNLDATDKIIQARKLAQSLGNGEILLADVFAQVHQNHPTDRVLLIADQFEELYTLCTAQEIRCSFLDTLLASFQSSPSQTEYNHVLVTIMRTDFLGNALSYPQFGEVLRNADVKIRSMNHDELSQVIVKPADKLGATFEAGLVERILDDVENEPGNLPLLEFALTELWKRRRGKQLTHVAYKEIGEVQGALARHADENYCKLSVAEQEQVRRIFIQLVHPGEGTEDTRRLATKAELSQASWGLVKKLADARLVVTSRNAADQETVEVVHEALIRNWGELRQWMDTDRNFRAWQEQLRVVKRQWEDTGKDNGALLRGAPLANAEDWQQKRLNELSSEERVFIQLSLALRDRENKEQELRRRRTTLGLAAGFVGALILAGVAGIGWWGTFISNKNSELIARSFTLESSFSSNNQLDALLEGIRVGKQLKQLKRLGGATAKTRMQVVTALRKVVYGIREYNRLEGHSGEVSGISFSPDGETIASASWDGTVKIWSKEGALLKTLTGGSRGLIIFAGHTGGGQSISFSPDGQMIAAPGEDNTIKLWSTLGEELNSFKSDKYHVTSVSFSPDGQVIASAGNDGIKLWKQDGSLLKTLTNKTLTDNKNQLLSTERIVSIYVSNGKANDESVEVLEEDSPLFKTLTKTLTNNSDQSFNSDIFSQGVNSVSFSPDGQTIVSTGNGGIKLWKKDGSSLKTSSGNSFPTGISYSVSFSPDGQTIVSAGNGGTIVSAGNGGIKLWKKDGSSLKTSSGNSFPTGISYSVSFSPDGQTIVSAGNDGIKLWKKDGSLLTTLIGHRGRIASVRFSPDGKTVASGSWDSTVKLWRRKSTPLTTLKAHEGRATSVSFSPDGQTIATSSYDNTVKLWQRDGTPIKTIAGIYGGPHLAGSGNVIFSPDGQMLVSASGRIIKLWRRDGSLLNTLEGHKCGIESVAFSPDGNTLASASADKTVKLWRRDGALLKTFEGHDCGELDHTASVSFSLDGQMIASASENNIIKLQRTDGTLLKTIIGDNVSFSPDGQTIASTDKGTVKLWKLDGTSLTTLIGHSGKVNSFSFSPDGQIIATASNDKTIKLWLRDGTLITTLKKNTASFGSVSFSPDGKILASGENYYGGVVTLWNLDIDDLIRRGCDWVGDYLKNNSNVSKEDRRLCDEIGNAK